jgi:hypothetical protein
LISFKKLNSFKAADLRSRPKLIFEAAKDLFAIFFQFFFQKTFFKKDFFSLEMSNFLPLRPINNLLFEFSFLFVILDINDEVIKLFLLSQPISLSKLVRLSPLNISALIKNKDSAVSLSMT